MRLLITDEVTEIRDGLPDENIEHCDVCGLKLEQMRGEDFFVEDADGSHVYCEAHWPEGDDVA